MTNYYIGHFILDIVMICLAKQQSSWVALAQNVFHEITLGNGEVISEDTALTNHFWSPESRFDYDFFS